MKRRMVTVYRMPRPEFGANFYTLCAEEAERMTEYGEPYKVERMAVYGALPMTEFCSFYHDHDAPTPWLSATLYNA